MTWEPLSTSLLKREHLESLAAGEVPVVVIPAFWSESRVSEAVDSICRHGLGSYSTPSLSGLGLIGIAMSDHKAPAAKAGYFEKVPAATAERLAIFGEAGDPVADFLATLEMAWGKEVEVASDGGRLLSPGIIRGWAQSTEVHIDWAPVDTQNWSMNDIHGQWSIVMHLATAMKGGALKVYRREYSAACQPFKQQGSWGYDRTVVSDVPHARYSPNPGDVAIIFTKYFHEVEPVESTTNGIERITVSSFIGHKPDDTLVLWG